MLNATHRLMRFKTDIIAAVQQQQQQHLLRQQTQQQWLTFGPHTLSASSTAESFSVSPFKPDYVQSTASLQAAAATTTAVGIPVPQKQQQQGLLLHDPQQQDLLLADGRRIATNIILKARSLAAKRSPAEMEALLLHYNGAKQQQQNQQQPQQTCCNFATAEEALKLCDATASLVAAENSLLEVN